jgi:hypothetical protein
MSLLLLSNQDLIGCQDSVCFRVSIGSVFNLMAQVERGFSSSCKIHNL